MELPAKTRPVLIVGAGPTGLTAALELSRMGVAVRIIDRLDGPSTTSKALAVQARTIELLEPRGVGTAMLEQGKKARFNSLYRRGNKLAVVDFERISSRVNALVLLPQSVTERLICEQLRIQGVSVERKVELASFTHYGSGPNAGVRAVLKNRDGDEEIFDSAYLISAEGAHSSVRRALGLPFDGVSIPQRYLLADVQLAEPLQAGDLSLCLSSGNFVVVFPLDGNRCHITATDMDGDAQDSDRPTLPELQRVVDRIVPFPIRMREVESSSRFFINSRHIAALRVGRVLLGGDAAHVHSPAGGQGMNTGIQDMVNLCWKLAMVLRGHAHPALLDTYQAERLPVIKKLIRSTESASKALVSANPFVRQVVTRLVPIALGRKLVQTRAVAGLSQVRVHYRDSPMNQADRRAGRLRAGDRVPDVDLRPVGTHLPERIRLYEMLDLARLTLLVTDPGIDVDSLSRGLKFWDDVVTVVRATVECAQPDMRGLDVRLAADLAAYRGLIVIRPDSYLAALPDSPSALIAWLETWFISRRTG